MSLAMMVWCFGAWRWVASAISFRFAGVAPVRGGTHFLCRRKESKQRKRAHTASTCAYPRALNVPIPHAATLWFFFVARAPDTRLTPFNHFFNGARQRFARAHLRQTVCRFSRCNTRCSCQKTFCARTLVARQATHSLPQGGRDSLPVLAGVRVSGAGEALIESAGNRGWAETCRMRDGDVERPWVNVKGWRC